MSEKQEKKQWTKLEKGLGIFAIILIGTYFFFLAEHYGAFQFDAWNVPIEMTEPARTFQCQQTLEELMELKNFLGIGDVMTQEQIDEISWSDYEYLVRLELKLSELKCTLEPDT